MIKKAKSVMKMSIIILLGILTFNVVYDIGVSSSAKIQEEKVRDVTNFDRVAALAEQEAAESATRPTEKSTTESRKSRVIKYVSIVGILIVAIAMLVILANKEELDD